MNISFENECEINFQIKKAWENSLPDKESFRMKENDGGNLDLQKGMKGSRYGKYLGK